MKNIRLLFILLVGCLPGLLNAQEKLNTDLALPYLVQQPVAASAHPPVIILMHGYGSNEADVFEVKDALPHDFLVISVRAPYSLGDNAFQWFGMKHVDGNIEAVPDELQKSIEKIKALVPAIIKKYHADPSQVYLSGFSQGGMMSFAVGLTAPGLFRGIVPLSGRIFASTKPQVQATAALKKLKIFIGHGDADNRVPYSSATDAVSFLKQLGLSPQLHTYKGLKHSISKEELQDISKWLNAK